MPNTPKTPTLRPEAAALLAQATALLATLGTDPRKLAALVVASDLCEEAQDTGLSWEETAEGWLGDSWEVVRSDLCDAAAFATIPDTEA